MDSGYKFVGGLLCLDFVNTVGARVRAPGRQRSRDYAGRILREKLATYADLARWGVAAGALRASDGRALARRAAANEREAKRALTRAVTFREALYRVLKSVVEQWTPAKYDVEIVNGALAVARGRQSLSWRGAGFRWTTDTERDALDRVLHAVALSAAELLSSDDPQRVRQCGGAECGWLFLDRSRNRSRQWCDMKDCGNRAKVKRFRQKRSTSPRTRGRT